MLDLDVQLSSYLSYGVNNTYDIRLFDETTEAIARDNLERPGGCRDQGTTCRQLQLQYDPADRGTNTSVNGVCAEALEYCLDNVVGLFASSGVSRVTTPCFPAE